MAGGSLALITQVQFLPREKGGKERDEKEGASEHEKIFCACYRNEGRGREGGRQAGREGGKRG